MRVAGVQTVDEAIRCLQSIKDHPKYSGNTKIQFGDGSPVALVITNEHEESREPLAEVVVQVRLDKATWASKR